MEIITLKYNGERGKEKELRWECINEIASRVGSFFKDLPQI